MIAAAAALIVVGLVLLFFLPWVGIPVAIVGAVLAVLFAIGWGRRATAHDSF